MNAKKPISLRRRAALRALAMLPLLAFFVGAGSATARGAELIMFEQENCYWCERFHEEIAPIYPRTAEGKRAPLRMVDIHGTLPEDLSGIDTGRFTPTFVLMEDGREIGRIRGYPGDEFFWGLLGELLAKLPKETKSGEPHS